MKTSPEITRDWRQLCQYAWHTARVIATTQNQNTTWAMVSSERVNGLFEVVQTSERIQVGDHVVLVPGRHLVTPDGRVSYKLYAEKQ